MTRRGYGALRRLPSGRYQASHIGPDGRRYNAPETFDTRGDADAWLAAQRTDIARDEWQPPAPHPRPAPTTSPPTGTGLVGQSPTDAPDSR